MNNQNNNQNTNNLTPQQKQKLKLLLQTYQSSLKEKQIPDNLHSIILSRVEQQYLTQELTNPTYVYNRQSVQTSTEQTYSLQTLGIAESNSNKCPLCARTEQNTNKPIEYKSSIYSETYTLDNKYIELYLCNTCNFLFYTIS